MLNAKSAAIIAQNTNRENWVKNALREISHKVSAMANKGARETVISLETIVTGAENLTEGAEMMNLISSELKANNYTHVIDPHGNLILKW